LVGFYLAFMPLYVLGFMGMTRRLNHTDNPEWTPWLYVAFVGALFVAAGIGFMLLQLYVSIRDRHKNQDVSGDPWDGRTLEWSTSSPPPFYNFAEQPVVSDLDAYWGMKERGEATANTADYKQIHMPRNTGMGVLMSFFGLILGFAAIWHIWWAAAIGLAGMVITLIVRSYDDDIDYYVPAEEVARIEGERMARLANAARVDSRLNSTVEKA
jgi:cytochrome o ubiquinol oxidase subunit 1